MATHSGVLAWRIPGTGEPGGLPSMELQSWTRLKRLSSSSSMSAAYEAKNKPREPTAVLSSGPEVPHHSAFSFPPFRVFLCLFCVFYQGLLVVYSG